MKLKELTREELECMPYDEIAYLILIETGKKEKLINLYKKICKLVNKKFEDEQDQLPEFFEILTTNKKFVMLKNGYWDLQVNHKLNIELDETLEEILDEEEIEELEEQEKEQEKDEIEEENLFYEREETDDTADNDLANLVVISDEEEETN
ncbi:MAG: hypothetical protein R3Y13_03535 [bacterium]